MNWVDRFKAARRAGVPLIVIRASDYGAVISIIDALRLTGVNGSATAILQHDVMRGIRGVNDLGSEQEAIINGEDGPKATSLLSDALERGLDLMGDNSILFMLNIHIPLESIDPSIRLSAIQGISNMRDPFKSTHRSLVMLCTDLKVPPELTNDVITIDVPLPNREELAGKVSEIAEAGGVKPPKGEEMEPYTDALLGLSAFAGEQIAAMSLTRKGFDVQEMWAMKIADINRTPGLRAQKGSGASFEKLKGMDNIITFGQELIASEEPPAVIVLMDEIEKALAGMEGTSGVEADAVGQLLTAMEENQWDGMLLPGFPGSGKTEWSKSLGMQCGLFVWMDLGSMRGQFVGQSEKMIREALAKLLAIGGSRVFFIGTCNSVSNIPAALFRRLSAGTYFFDFPRKEAQVAMWAHYMKAYEIKDQEIPAHENWTGAEIRKCCFWARKLRKLLVEYAPRIAPVYRILGDEVGKLRRQASGKYLRVDAPGEYSYTKKPMAPVSRTIGGGSQTN